MCQFLAMFISQKFLIVLLMGLPAPQPFLSVNVKLKIDRFWKILFIPSLRDFENDLINFTFKLSSLYIHNGVTDRFK